MKGRAPRVRRVSIVGRVLFNAAFIVITQWVVFAHSDDWRLRLAVLAVPALIASYALTKALTVTTYEPPRRGERR